MIGRDNLAEQHSRGGGMGVTADGRRDHTKDHSRKDSTAVAFLNNMKHNVPINVILGES